MVLKMEVFAAFLLCFVAFEAAHGAELPEEAKAVVVRPADEAFPAEVLEAGNKYKTQEFAAIRHEAEAIDLVAFPSCAKEHKCDVKSAVTSEPWPAASNVKCWVLVPFRSSECTCDHSCGGFLIGWGWYISCSCEPSSYSYTYAYAICWWYENNILYWRHHFVKYRAIKECKCTPKY